MGCGRDSREEIQGGHCESLCRVYLGTWQDRKLRKLAGARPGVSCEWGEEFALSSEPIAGVGCV